jgi:hypothetical protein
VRGSRHYPEAFAQTNAKIGARDGLELTFVPDCFSGGRSPGRAGREPMAREADRQHKHSPVSGQYYLKPEKVQR